MVTKARYTISTLRGVVAGAKALIMDAPDEGVTIDVLGEVKAVERGLASLRGGAQAEFEDGQTGGVWRIEKGRRSINSYNTPKLIRSFAEAMGISSWDAFVQLWRSDVVRISWQQSNLERAAAKHRVTLTTAPHEITEGEDAHVGTYWVDGYASYKRVD
jgi:hypothetical protein